MTSRTSSRVKSSQKYITRNRIWLISLMILASFLVYIVFFLLQMRNDRYTVYNPSHEAIQAALNTTAFSYLSGESASTIFAVAYALLLGLTSFNYLYKSNTIDFYFSIPKKKMAYFKDVCMNSILIYVIISGVFYALATLFASFVGLDITKSVMSFIGMGYLSNFILFLAYYAMCIFAQAVCGNTFISILMAGYLITIEMALRFTIRMLAEKFFDTYANIDGYLLGNVWTSPLYNVIEKVDASSCVKNLVLALIFFVLAFVSYKFYKGEFAGKAVVYKGVRYLVKISTSMFAAIWTAIILLESFSYSNKEFVFYIILGNILGAVIISAICEVVFARDIHALFKKIWQAPILAGVSILFFASFVLDWYSYDSFVPEKEDVVDCAIAVDSNEADYQYIINEEDMSLQQTYGTPYAAKYMHLPYTDQVKELAKLGMENKKNWESDKNSSYLYNLTIIYRMKNGREVYRNLAIYADTDENLLNAIVGSDEYKNTSFTMDNIDNWRRLTNGYNVLYYGGYYQKLSDDQIDEFLEAYRKDLKHFNYTTASHDLVYGNAVYTKETLNKNQEDGTSAGETTELFSQGFPIYESFTNSIAFLEKCDLFNEMAYKTPAVEDISYIEVSYDKDGFSALEGDLSELDLPYGTSEVYDYDVMGQILSSVVPSYGAEYNFHWNNPTRYSPFTIRVYVYYSDVPFEYAFLRDSVPEVLMDLEYESSY